jgi:hypothetical protein
MVLGDGLSKEEQSMGPEIYIIIGILVAIGAFIFFFEYRARQPDMIVLYESRGRLGIRKGALYPRHFSLPIKRTTHPLQLAVEATAAGNLGVRIRIIGSVAPSLEHIQALIRVGGWNGETVARAAEEVKISLEQWVKEFSERSEIHVLSSAGIMNYLNERASQVIEKFGVELLSLAVQSLEPSDPEIADALRQQEQARLLEETERLNHTARSSAAKARFQADEEIAEMEHTLELKKASLEKALLEKESALAHQRLTDELERDRLRLSFEKEELEILRGSPELLMLTPQAARLAEASQSLRNARTVISLTPQDLVQKPELLVLFQEMLQKALKEKKED